MALANRIRFLEMPQLLKKEGLLFQFILVADDVAGIGRGNTKYFECHVTDQFPAVDAGRSLDRVLVFYFEVLALRGNAPSAQGFYFSLRIRINGHGAMPTTIGPENLVSLANLSPDLVG